MYCPNCNLEFDSKFCPECGTKLVERIIMWCPNCEKESDSKFCPDCGTKIVQKTAGGATAPQAPTPPPPVSCASVMSEDKKKEAEDLFQMGKKYDQIDLFGSLMGTSNPEEERAKLTKAVQYYEMAANLGHVEAQYELGWLYNPDNDDAFEKNSDKSKFWYKKAAEQNHIGALIKVFDFDTESIAYLQKLAEEADVKELFDVFGEWDWLEDWLNDVLSFGKELWEDNKKSMAIDVYKFVAQVDSDSDEYVVDAIRSARQFLRDHGYDW